MMWLRARTTGVMPWLAVGTLLGVLFVTAPAAADLPSPDPAPKPVAAATSANPGETSDVAEAEAPPPVVHPSGHKKRPVFMALLAVGFLIFAGVVGANDKPEGDSPKPAL
ncbi:MAG: hypothetical protein R3B07_24195 [Polyangiaceae bacterium]